MKIAIFSDNFYPELSGISDSIIILAKYLVKLGHIVEFFVPKHPNKNFHLAKLPLGELDLGKKIEIHRLSSLPFPTPTKQARLVLPTGFNLLAIKKFNPDIIHSQLFFGVGLEALLAAKILKIPLVGTNHTRIDEIMRYSLVKNKSVAKYMLRYMIWYYNRCNYVTAPSKLFLEEMKKNGFNRPAQIISNPVDFEIFNPGLAKNIKLTKNKFKLSETTIIYAGRLAGEKNIDVIIKALPLVKKSTPKINLAICGHGSAQDSLLNLAKELGVAKNVKFLGTFDKPNLAKIYQASKIFVIASTSEVQSMTVLQAMACGLPIICARCNSMPDLVNNRNGFLIEPYDYKTLAEKITLLLNNHQLRKNLSQGSLDFVQKFSAENIAKKWEELYKQVKNNFNKIDKKKK